MVPGFAGADPASVAGWRDRRRTDWVIEGQARHIDRLITIIVLEGPETARDTSTEREGRIVLCDDFLVHEMSGKASPRGRRSLAVGYAETREYIIRFRPGGPHT